MNNRQKNINESIKNLKKIHKKKFSYKQGLIKIETDDILITSKKKVFNLGKFTIEYRTKRNPYPRVISHSSRRYGVSHPHVSYGSMCLGDYHDYIETLFLKGHIDECINIFLKILNSSYAAEGYSKLSKIVESSHEYCYICHELLKDCECKK